MQRRFKFTVVILVLVCLTSCGDSSPPNQPVPTAAPIEQDGDALVALYNATDGANWMDNWNWLNGAPNDSWAGVATDLRGRVVGIDLGANWLNGQIPPELGNLTNLKTLSLYGNLRYRVWLNGQIPPELGNLTELVELNLFSNQLSGQIPPELGNLTKLEGLNLLRTAEGEW